MSFCGSPTIHRTLRESEVTAIAEQMAEILDYLHGLESPIIHRDFTPDNLMYMSSGKVKLLDFNVALRVGVEDGRRVVGKHSYIPPEQFKGKATIQSDLYALGATMFFLLTGEDPLPISTSHPALTAPHVSPELDAVVARVTDPILDNRYANSRAFAADLKRLRTTGNLVNS